MNEDEVAAGVGVEMLERLTNAQDADAVFAMLYISRVLAPPAPLPPNMSPTGRFKLDDIMDKIGWKPRSTEERHQLRARIWDFIRYGARARVVGERSIPYYEKDGKEIETRIDSPLWATMGEQKQIQLGLFPSLEIPLAVEIVLSSDYTRLIMNPHTVQYLPLGELLGSIPGDQPSGAWARALGLALANYWRRHPKETIDGSLFPTREELLTRYTPKVAPPLEMLSSANPQRAREYFRQAISILEHKGFLEIPSGAAQQMKESEEKLPRKNWKDIWLQEYIELKPGQVMYAALQTIAESQYQPKPRNLKRTAHRLSKS